MTAITAQPMTHLLVTLDGSRLAESAIRPTITLARRLGARVTLLHILERDAPETIHGERHLTNIGEAAAYLHGIASRFADAGVAVETHAHPSPEEDVAASIAVHALGHRADLILMCAHGRGGWRDWFLGGIAQRTVRRAAAPILLIRQETKGPETTFAPRTVTVALDGTAEGERALPRRPDAGGGARRLVAPPPGRGDPGDRRRRPRGERAPDAERRERRPRTGEQRRARLPDPATGAPRAAHHPDHDRRAARRTGANGPRDRHPRQRQSGRARHARTRRPRSDPLRERRRTGRRTIDRATPPRRRAATGTPRHQLMRYGRTAPRRRPKRYRERRA